MRPPGMSAPRLQHDASKFLFFSGQSQRGLSGGGVRRSAAAEYNLGSLVALSAPQPAPPPRSAPQALLFWLVLRLKFLILALPFVAVALGAYAAVYAASAKYASGVPVDVTLFAPIITCVFFVLSIVFSNVIADYKESEKIPAEFVAYFSSLASFAVSEAREHGFSARPLLLDVQAMLLCVLSTLDKKRGFVADMHAFHSAAVAFKTYARARGVHEIEGPEHAQDEIVKKLTRIHDIGRLSIILPACACAAIRC